MVRYAHLIQNFPQFIAIYTVKGFGIVNKAEIDVFLELSCFFDDPSDVGNLISGSLAFSKANTCQNRPVLPKNLCIHFCLCCLSACLTFANWWALRNPDWWSDHLLAMPGG